MPLLKKLLPDVLIVAGIVSVSYGAWLIYPPLGYIVPGAFAITAAVRLG